MKRLSVLGFFGLLAGVLGGCPIFSGEGNNTGYCWDGNCGGSGGYAPGCYSSAECSQNETCGNDGQCHSGDCTIWGCSSGVCVIDPSSQTANCVQGGTGGANTGGSTNVGGAGGATTGSGGAGGATTTTSGSGGAGGATTTTSGSGGAGGSAPAPTCTVEGQQGECAAGSICLHNLCWISCETPNEGICAQQQTLNTCQVAIDQNKTLHNVCGDAVSGTECSIPSQLCAAGLDCVNGYCK